MGIQELGHVVLYVRDVKRSAAFYRDVLGFRQIVDGGLGAAPVAAFSSGRTHHELLLIEVGPQAASLPRGRRLGLYHIGFKVGDSDDELRDMLKQLQQAGADVVGSSDHGMTHSIYLLDPDGNELELYVDVPGVDWNDAETIMQAPRPLVL